MDINKFTQSEFGELTTLTNPNTGVTMFFAAEIGRMWGHTNMKQVVNRVLNPSEYKVIKKSQFPDFFKILVSNNLLPAKAQHIQLVTESAVYKLALASNLEKAKPFRDWVTGEILPSLRKSGTYSLSQMDMKQLSDQTMRTIQLENSKTINTKHYEQSGVLAVIEYNKSNCKQVTGMEPAEIKKIYGKKNKSAKELLREHKPELAATMSLNDFFVAKDNVPLVELKELDRLAVDLFKEMNRIGIRVVE